MSPQRQGHRGANHQQIASNANPVRATREVRLGRGNREQESSHDERRGQVGENGPTSRHLRPDRTWRRDRGEILAVGPQRTWEVGHASARMR
jgi:hypothetical protein